MSNAPWYDEMRKLEGLKEIVGSKHEPKIVAFFADAGFPGVKDDETAWCAAAMNAMLRKAGYRGTNSLMARSFLEYGEALSTPREGCIVVFKRGNSTWQGHVTTFVKKVPGNKIVCLGGNQGNAIRENPYGTRDVLGYRWPKESDKLPSIATSKIATSGTVVSVAELGDMGLQVKQAIKEVKINDYLEGSKQAKDIAESFSLYDTVVELTSTPRFWVSVVVIILTFAIIYWRWRDHGKGQ